VRFGTATYCTKGILDSVHTDVWGPTKTSIRGNHYFVSFIDNYSRRMLDIYHEAQRESLRVVCGVEEEHEEEFGKEDQGTPFRQCKRVYK